MHAEKQVKQDERSRAYTVYLRFPFPRNGFPEPHVIEWNQDKENELWSILSRAHKRTEIKWPQLAEYFNVSIPFLLQQAAWLYERELQQVREEMQRVTSQSAVLSDLTPLQSSSSFTPADRRASRIKSPGHTSPAYSTPPRSNNPDLAASTLNFRTRLQQHGGGSDDSISTSSQYSGDNHERDDEHTFVPLFSNEEHNPPTPASLKSSFARTGFRTQPARLPAVVERPPRTNTTAVASTRGSKPNSTGSSFSDISDASISRSALEEALLSDLKNGGGMSSRISTISGALRSKYFDR
ncbi:hypothetical protein V1517DRAFT_324620 [Lipomyces orientalis]|uniref:Uncharacterized protein n=1 Tax=Lipomyces orientalis TaxID=1233043 RepID=A0ACC3TLT3_9ASCO